MTEVHGGSFIAQPAPPNGYLFSMGPTATSTGSCKVHQGHVASDRV